MQSHIVAHSSWSAFAPRLLRQQQRSCSSLPQLLPYALAAFNSVPHWYMCHATAVQLSMSVLEGDFPSCEIGILALTTPCSRALRI
jgi:hypothetical protein